MRQANMTLDDYARARRLLIRRDPVLAPVIRKYHARSLLDTPRVTGACSS